jgi:DNA ligase-associated metallophosphoesterase
MPNALPTKIAGEDVLLLPEKAIFWSTNATLLVADAHLGKAAHFRKNGVALPDGVALKDLQLLQRLVDVYKPQHLVFLGDLFHSAPNREWNWFTEWLDANPQLAVTLVAGNHDIFINEHEIAQRLTIVESLTLAPFLLTHEPLKTSHEVLYNLCGHIHPGVRLSGKAGQSLRLPCFWFGETQGILPAFGNLTGHLRQKGKATVFAIANNSIMLL